MRRQPGIRLGLYASLLVLSGCSLFGGHLTPDSKHSVYTVKKGDTLVRIADRYGTTVSTLVRSNDIDDPNDIEPGTELLVPARLQRKSPNSHFTGGQLTWPVDGGEIVSGFGPRGDSFHDGLDIAAPEGSAVYAAHDGTVAYSDNELSGYGELVIVKSSSSLITIYAHNSRRLVKQGDSVKRGDQIAEVGQTGHASGPHLHFELRVKDPGGNYAAVDPAPLLHENNHPSLRYRINESLTPILARLGSWTGHSAAKE